MFTMKKSPQKENIQKYTKKNIFLSNQKDKYKPINLNILNNLPNLSNNNFSNIISEFDEEYKKENIITEKVEILEDGSVCRKNTKNTTRVHSPQRDPYNNNNLFLNDYIENEDYIYNTDLKNNKSNPYIRSFTYTKDDIYIPHKPYNNSGKRINIKSKKKELNYKRALFNKNENYEYDIVNQWKYLSNKYIMNYNKKILSTNIQIIIQNLKIRNILKKKEKIPTNLIHIINHRKENFDEINKIFEEVEKKYEKGDKIIKYKSGIESINEEMNESNEDLEERNSIRSNKIKAQLKQIKQKDELEIKDIESISFSPTSVKSKDIKFIFNKNNNENNNKRFNININSYKKILKMAFNNKNKKELKLTKEKYESLIFVLINNFICFKKRSINNTNINNNIRKDILDNLDKKIFELEESVKSLKSIYLYGMNNIKLILNENDRNVFVKKLNLTKNRNNVKKIYKEIVAILNNNMIGNKIYYYQKIIDILKKYEKIEEIININNNTNYFINIIKTIFIFLPIIMFVFYYFLNNFKKI